MRPMGDAGLQIEVAELSQVLALADAIRDSPPPGVLDVVPAARTVLLVLEPGTDLAATRRAVLDLPIELGAGRSAKVGASLGVSFGGRDTDIDTLIRRADLAMYTAKRNGRGTTVYYDPSLETPQPATPQPSPAAPQH